ncbi:MAG: sugar nucleotide-binding protein [Chloroflexi bacterium]|nr:sugar nucleotide-binding protein [Chloroflexota bacterium]
MTSSNILLTGGSGKLGRHIINSGLIQNILHPPKDVLDITEPTSVKNFFEREQISVVIHCAALARMRICEAEPCRAIAINIVGTSNLVKQLIETEKRYDKKIRFIHISTDGVYPGVRGNYSEKDETIPYNVYGWTKLGAEAAVNALSNHCIIRTRFFDPNQIEFEESATDIFTSGMPLDDLVKAIQRILAIDFVGTVNIGNPRLSDYDRYRAYKPSLKPCTREDIAKCLPFEIPWDSSMDCSLWEGLSLQR